MQSLVSFKAKTKENAEFIEECFCISQNSKKSRSIKHTRKKSHRNEVLYATAMSKREGVFKYSSTLFMSNIFQGIHLISQYLIIY